MFVRDRGGCAALHGKTSATDKQQAWALDAVRKPVVDQARAERVFETVLVWRAPMKCALRPWRNHRIACTFARMGTRYSFRGTSVIVATAVAFALSSATAFGAGATRYAAPTGSGTTCSQVLPCDLQTAVESAASGDQVVITPGTYQEAANALLVPAGVSVTSVSGKARPRIFAPNARCPFGLSRRTFTLYVEAQVASSQSSLARCLRRCF